MIPSLLPYYGIPENPDLLTLFTSTRSNPPFSCPCAPFATPWGHVKSERSSSGLIRQPHLAWGNSGGREPMLGHMRCLGWGMTVVGSWRGGLLLDMWCIHLVNIPSKAKDSHICVIQSCNSFAAVAWLDDRTPAKKRLFLGRSKW